MLHEFIGMLPERLQHVGPGFWFIIVGMGVFVGLLGARVHRSVVALSLVATGTVIGLHLPRWFGWGIDPMGTAFGAAIILGGSGYILTTLWEGILLGTILAALAGAFVWLGNAPGAIWHWPGIDGSASAIEAGYRIWVSLPPTINRSLPAAVGVGAMVGAGIMVISPRLGRTMLFGILATALVAAGGVLAANRINPGMLDLLPTDPWTAASILGCVSLFFAGVQWLILPKSIETTRRDQSDKTAADPQAAHSPATLTPRPASARTGQPSPQMLRPHKVPALMK